MCEVRARPGSGGGSGKSSPLVERVGSSANIRLFPMLLLMSVRIAVLEFIFALPCAMRLPLNEASLWTCRIRMENEYSGDFIADQS